MIEAVFVWITANLGYISGFLAALLLVIEQVKALPWHPLTRILRFIGKRMNADVHEEISLFKKELAQHIQRDDEMHCHVRQQLDEYHRNLVCLKQDIDENEKDRIRQIIYHYGSIVRNDGKITLEEFRYLQDIYYKYNGPLNGNGKVSEEYKMVSDYFNSL